MFFRHCKTKLNDGTFLGKGRDPAIQNTSDLLPLEVPVSRIYSSPMRRCKQTAAELFQDQKIVTDDRLVEFNYGEAEGLTYEAFSVRYPAVISAWANGEDPSFPNGENTRDVNMRLNHFLDNVAANNLNPTERIGVVTHNGVLRCLLGSVLGLPLESWHKLFIPHTIQLDFLLWRGRFYPNLPRPIWAQIFHNFGSNPQ